MKYKYFLILLISLILLGYKTKLLSRNGNSENNRVVDNFTNENRQQEMVNDNEGSNKGDIHEAVLVDALDPFNLDSADDLGLEEDNVVQEQTPDINLNYGIEKSNKENNNIQTFEGDKINEESIPGDKQDIKSVTSDLEDFQSGSDEDQNLDSTNLNKDKNKETEIGDIEDIQGTSGDNMIIGITKNDEENIKTISGNEEKVSSKNDEKPIDLETSGDVINLTPDCNNVEEPSANKEDVPKIEYDDNNLQGSTEEEKILKSIQDQLSIQSSEGGEENIQATDAENEDKENNQENILHNAENKNEILKENEVLEQTPINTNTIGVYIPEEEFTYFDPTRFEMTSTSGYWCWQPCYCSHPSIKSPLRKLNVCWCWFPCWCWFYGAKLPDETSLSADLSGLTTQPPLPDTPVPTVPPSF